VLRIDDSSLLRQQMRTENDAKAAKQLTAASTYDTGFSLYKSNSSSVFQL